MSVFSKVKGWFVQSNSNTKSAAAGLFFATSLALGTSLTLWMNERDSRSPPIEFSRPFGDVQTTITHITDTKEGLISIYKTALIELTEAETLNSAGKASEALTKVTSSKEKLDRVSNTQIDLTFSAPVAINSDAATASKNREIVEQAREAVEAAFVFKTEVIQNQKRATALKELILSKNRK